MTNQKYQTNPPKTINNTYIYLQLKIETNWIQKKTHTHTIHNDNNLRFIEVNNLLKYCETESNYIAIV